MPDVSTIAELDRAVERLLADARVPVRGPVDLRFVADHLGIEVRRGAGGASRAAVLRLLRCGLWSHALMHWTSHRGVWTLLDAVGMARRLRGRLALGRETTRQLDELVGATGHHRLRLHVLLGRERQQLDAEVELLPFGVRMLVPAHYEPCKWEPRWVATAARAQPASSASSR
jgi:hypothetical protein